MYEMLRMKNTWSAPRAVEFAAKLCQINSPSFHEAALADVVEHQMRVIGFDKVLRDGAGNVVGVLMGRDEETTVLLNSHMDTVPAGDAKEWKRSPLSGEIHSDRLIGLGASDCKAGLAAQVFAGELLKNSLLPLQGNLVVAATVAEENGMGVGLRTLIEQTLPELGLKPSYAILGEPTGLGLYYGHDGWVEMDVRIEGSNPFQVDDAAQAIFQEIRSDKGGLESRSSRRPTFDQFEGRRRAVLQIEKKLSPSQDVEDVIRQVQHEAARVAQSVGTLAVEVAVCQKSRQLYSGKTTAVRRVTHAWMTDPFHPLMERARHALAAAGCAVKPGKWQLGKPGMGTSGGVLVNEYKIPTIGFGPGEEVQAHAANESVSTQAVAECVYGTAAIVHSLIGVPVFGWTTDEI